MRKDPSRDYTTYAFVQYKELGCPTKRELEKRIESKVFERYSFKAPDIIHKILERELRKNQRLIDDINAVNVMFDMLYGKIPVPDGFNPTTAKKNGADIADAVKKVYLSFNRKNLSSRKIALSVRNYAINVPCDVRTVYRRLKYARQLFAVVRRISFEWTADIKISDEN